MRWWIALTIGCTAASPAAAPPIVVKRPPARTSTFVPVTALRYPDPLGDVYAVGVFSEPVTCESLAKKTPHSTRVAS